MGGDIGTTLVPVAHRALEYRRLVDRNRYLERQLDVSARFDGMVGTSRAVREIQELVASVAPTTATVLILGESGTGKELVARAVHKQSTRSGKPFVDVNCGALAESLLESELFGHARGAFTGAHAARRGLFEEASGGTLFLDEIGEISPALQVGLLRVLQEGTVRPVGANHSVAVDVRVIASTNRDLERDVQAGRFRQDLFFRLNVVAIDVPPLRDRPEDIVPLAYHFLEKRGAKLGKTVHNIDPDALARLTAYRWPGNVRELENAIERGIVLSRSDTITVDLLPPTVLNAAPGAEPTHSTSLLPPLAGARDQFEREYVERAIALAGGSLTEAARLADVDRSNFRRMVKRLRSEEG
jgi:DNA-binding NtrC family response regulator